MSMSSNIGAECAAKEIKSVVEAELDQLTQPNVIAQNITAIKSLQTIIKKCDEIIGSASLGWY